MAPHDGASTVTVDTKTSVNVVSDTSSNALQDTKKPDAEQNYPDTSNPRELKRKLKSRHLQMIAIGTSTSR
jgi:amino acid transporter